MPYNGLYKTFIWQNTYHPSHLNLATRSILTISEIFDKKKNNCDCGVKNEESAATIIIMPCSTWSGTRHYDEDNAGLQ